MHGAVEDAGQELVLLRLRAVLLQGRADGLQCHRRQRHVGARGLVGEDLLFDVAEALAAVLGGPAHSEPAVAAHPLDDLLVGLPVAGGGDVGGLVGRDERGEVLAQLGLQGTLGGRQVDERLSLLRRRVVTGRGHGVDGVGGDGLTERGQLQARAAHEAGQVLDRRGVPEHRVGDVHADAAVQVVQHLHRARALGGQPVGADDRVRLVAVVRPGQPLGDPPGDRLRDDVQRPRHDVDIRQLLLHRLERAERLAELLPLLEVVGGHVHGARDEAVTVRDARREDEAVEHLQNRLVAATAEHVVVVDRRGLEPHRVLRHPQGAEGGGQGDPRGVGGDDDDGVTLGGRHRDQHRSGLGRVPDGGDGAVQRPALKSHRGRRGQWAARLGHGGGQDAAVLDPLQQRLSLVGGAEGDDRQHAEAQGLQRGDHHARAADLLEHHGDVGHGQVVAAQRLRQAEGEQTGGGERRPQSLVEAGVLHAAAGQRGEQLLGGGRGGEGAGDRLGDGGLGLGTGEVHGGISP